MNLEIGTKVWVHTRGYWRKAKVTKVFPIGEDGKVPRRACTLTLLRPIQKEPVPRSLTVLHTYDSPREDCPQCKLQGRPPSIDRVVRDIAPEAIEQRVRDLQATGIYNSHTGVCMRCFGNGYVYGRPVYHPDGYYPEMRPETPPPPMETRGREWKDRETTIARAMRKRGMR